MSARSHTRKTRRQRQRLLALAARRRRRVELLGRDPAKKRRRTRSAVSW